MSTLRVASIQHVLLWLLLGIWLGGFALFPFVAITAFRSFPSPDAGLIVGPVLAGLHLYGAGAGVGYSHFGVSSSIAEIRLEVFGSASSTAPRW